MSKELSLSNIVLIVSMMFSFTMGGICGRLYEQKRSTITLQFTNWDGSHWDMTIKDKSLPGATKQLDEALKKYPNAKILP